jgi:hypothetical protein
LGKEIKIDFKKSMPLWKLIEYLPKEIFEFIPNRMLLNNDQISAHMLFFRNGQHMKIDDQVNEDDVIQMTMPVTGG